jgi:hypothetical protein
MHPSSIAPRALALGTTAADQPGRGAEQNAADERHRQRQPRIKREPRRETFAMLQVEEDFVEEVDGRAHRRNDKATDNADQRGEPDQARFSRSHQRAQAPGYLESGCGSCGQNAPPPLRIM